MTFGDVLRSADSPAAAPKGIGGDANTIWHCDDSANRIYELRTGDFSVFRYAASPTTLVLDIGGDATTIWYSEDSDDIYELSTIDLSVIRSAASPSSAPYGVGGDANTIWHSDAWINRTYELDTTDFSVIRYASTPTINPLGIGGNANRIWHCDLHEYIYELNTTDFSVIQSERILIVRSVGGDSDTLWDCYGITDDIYELDTGAPPTYTLSGTISDELGNTIRDADITISNGTTYTTTSDENGAYSQVVDSDTYDITVSKSRSRFHDITESSVSVTADTTLNITMLTDRMLGKLDRLKGMSIPGGIQI